MKTSNKLLIGLLTIVLLSVAGILVAARIILDQDTIKGNGRKVSKNVNIGEFDKVNVKGRFTVRLTQGGNSQLKINADENLVPQIESEVEDGELNVRLKGKISRKDKIELFITADSFKEIEMRGGANFEGDELKGETLDLKTSAGSHGSLKIDYKELKCETNSGAVLSLSGRTALATLMASSGSSLIAQELIAQKAEAKASSGAHMSISVSDQLDVEANSGGSISYSGNPVIKQINSNSGGSISKN